jgi:hypothetical protein
MDLSIHTASPVTEPHMLGRRHIAVMGKNSDGVE